MRIKGVGQEVHPPLGERSEFAPESLHQSNFHQILKDAGERPAAGWDQLLSQVDKAAKKLVTQPSMETLRSYRAAVQNFLKEAISGSYRMKGESRWDRRGNRRIFCVVQKVNQALEELTTEVLQKNAKPIELMARVDEIRGLLVDLYY